MKLIKKVAFLSAVSIGTLSSVSSYAAEQNIPKKELTQYGFVTRNQVYNDYSTHDSYDYNTPQINVYEETRDSEVYIYINVNQNNATVYVNGSTSGVSQESATRYKYHATETRNYEIRVVGYYGGEARTSRYVTVTNRDTTLELSKEYRDGNSYLIIKGRDDDGIKSVTVDGTSISFNQYKDEVSYRVYKTGTYTVKLTDKNNNTKTQSIYISVDDDNISLDLSHTSRSGKNYLVIKADSDVSINKVTVNGESISFPSNGGTQEYEVTKSGTYKVIVRDKEGYVRTDSIYIDVNENKNQKPVVKVTQNYKVNNTPGWYLIINATDDGSIASVTVNGASIPFDTVKGEAQYYVPIDGNYTINVTDNEGNTYTTTTYAAGNTGVVNVNNPKEIENSSGASKKIVFKLNSKNWTENGVAQAKMDMAPKAMNSRVYLPLRYIANALGIDSSKIDWNQKTKTVTIYKGSETVKVTVGSKTMYVNGKAVSMDAAPRVSGQRVMLPISQIKKAFASENIQLNWDNANKELTIIR